jgi:uncharacterized OB-fold protein
VSGAADPRDQAERLSADDMATQREGEFLRAALETQRAAAARAAVAAGTTGRCANCGARCLPQARYCDDECRADHEHRQRVLARQGRVG